MGRIVRSAVASVVAASVVLGSTAAAWTADRPEEFLRFDADANELPKGIAVDDDGNVYVSLTTRGELLRVPTGSQDAELFARIDGLGDGELGPIGLAIDEDGDVYAAVQSQDPAINGAWHFDATTGQARQIAGSEGIAFANDVAVVQDGVLFITDTVSGAVWRAPAESPAKLWIQDELLQSTAEPGLSHPIGANGVAVYGNDVYVAVTEPGHVVRIPIAADGSAGKATIFAELPEAVDGIAFGAAGNLVSAHPMANLITHSTPDGEISVIADETDGLDRPSTVAVRTDADGSMTVYIANSSVAMGTPPGHGPSILTLELDGAVPAGTGPSPSGSSATGPDTTISIEGAEMWFDPAELTLPAGETTALELVNSGVVLHNITIYELNVLIAAGPGQSSTGTVVDPPPGTYAFYCAVFGHRRAGMEGVLTVE